MLDVTPSRKHYLHETCENAVVDSDSPFEQSRCRPSEWPVGHSSGNVCVASCWHVAQNQVFPVYTQRTEFSSVISRVIISEFLTQLSQTSFLQYLSFLAVSPKISRVSCNVWNHNTVFFNLSTFRFVKKSYLHRTRQHHSFYFRSNHKSKRKAHFSSIFGSKDCEAQIVLLN